MAVNLHWTRPSTGLLVERCLAVRAFPVPHTAEATAAVVKVVGAEYGVLEERCFFSVTDNASVMDAAVRDHMRVGHTRRFHCIAHWLQLLVNDAVKASAVNESIKRVRLYIKKVLRRSTWARRLTELQEEHYNGREARKLFLDGGVRWSALYLMCERVAAVEKAIKVHLQELRTEAEERLAPEVLEEDEQEEEERAGLLLPTAAELVTVGQLVHLLRPVYEATNVVQADGDKAPISVVVPEVVKLYAHFQSGALEVKPARHVVKGGKIVEQRAAVVIPEEKLAEAIKALRGSLLIELNTRFGAGSAPARQGSTDFYYAATFLDHRKRELDTLKFAHPSTCEHTREFMTMLAAKWMHWEEELNHHQQQQDQDDEEEEVVEVVVEKEGAGAEGGLGGEEEEEWEEELTAEQIEHLRHAALHKAAAGGAAGVGDGVGSARVRQRERLSLLEHMNHARLEMDRYLKLEIEFRDLGGLPLEWWARRQMRLDFPYLSNLARRLLAIPASSAKAERVFSQAGLVLTDLRTRLGVRTVEDLMVLKYHHCDGHVYMTTREWAELNE